MLRRIIVTVTVLAAVATAAFAQRTVVKPGRNAFTTQQDIELGREVARDAEKQMQVVSNGDAQAYISALGQMLAAKAPNEHKFPFTFKIVNDKSINAFALPGGPIYIHRGAIEAADNEAQIAGVIGHEIGHVVMRHGTNQATKAQYAQAPLAILGGVFGNKGIGQVLEQLGGFAAGSILLRHSRDAETQSDILGTQILYDLGFDPRAMAQFFDKLAKEHKGSATQQFFSNHPIPENRIVRVNEEIRKLGALPPNPRTDSGDFQDVKRIMAKLADPPKVPAVPATPANAAPSTAPAPPSMRFVALQGAGVALRHPDNWKPSINGSHLELIPDKGVVNGNLAYGLISDTFDPGPSRSIEEATIKLIQELQKSNPKMRVIRSRIPYKVDNQRALLAELGNESPLGGEESNILVTVAAAGGRIRYFIQVAPMREFSQYEPAFRAVMDSVRLQ